jgi:hypothetical protein
VYNREKSIGKRTLEDRTVEVFASSQKLLVNYAESKMVKRDFYNIILAFFITLPTYYAVGSVMNKPMR